MKTITKWWNEKPLALILIIGCLFRLLSVIFSKGFGMHDDHFLIIEIAQLWVDGHHDWLPSAHPDGLPHDNHSFFYPGLHYYFFLLLQKLGIFDAQTKMFLVRLIHAIFSLSIIYYGFKITEKASGIKNAKMVGLLLSIFWFMPFLSVRNLVEIICIPPLIYSTWIFLKNENTHAKWIYLWCGILLGLAFSVRVQTILFSGGLILVLLLRKKMLLFLLACLGYLIGVLLTEGLIDYCIWGAPFVEFREYIKYNMANAYNYITLPWYNYLLTIGGILIPPISLFLLFGFFRNWKKNIMLFLPSFLFLVFHSYFPNKQERFILPIVPFIIILGYIGWTEFVSSSQFWLKRPKILKYCWVFFWTINIIPLLVISVSYSKKNRVETMSYLSLKKDLTSFVLEESINGGTQPPLFYLEKWVPYYTINSTYTTEMYYNQFKDIPKEQQAHYVVFSTEQDIEKRVTEFKRFFPALTYETTIEPSLIDKILFFLNPINKNQTTYIYKF